jgi:hypothetical protein
VTQGLRQRDIPTSGLFVEDFSCLLHDLVTG